MLGNELTLTGVRRYGRDVTAAAAQHDPGPGRPPFADATPAQVRAALIPEDAEAFDRSWRRAMGKATEMLDLAEVHRVLEAWRRTAWLTTAQGPEGYRRMLADADERLRTGTLPPGSVSLDEIKASIAHRLAAEQ